jgi:Holliday junction resolvasome RuvABC endonuclease subunit
MGSILVAGLDPAMANFGFAKMRLDLDTLGLSLEGVRTVSTVKMAGKGKVVRQNSDDLRRSRELHDAFHAEILGCTIAFGEIPSGAQHARSALGFGVALGVLASCPVPIIEVMPVETKVASVGSKTAEKPEIIAWAAATYPHIDWLTYQSDVIVKGKLKRKKGDLHDDNEHAADATAAVHAGIQTQQFKQLLALWRSGALNRS